MSKFDEKSALPYEKLVERLSVVKSRLGRPLTLSEKVKFGPKYTVANCNLVKGEEGYKNLLLFSTMYCRCSTRIWTTPRARDGFPSGEL